LFYIYVQFAKQLEQNNEHIDAVIVLSANDADILADAMDPSAVEEKLTEYRKQEAELLKYYTTGGAKKIVFIDTQKKGTQKVFEEVKKALASL